jgi:hypothetical protein
MGLELIIVTVQQIYEHERKVKQSNITRNRVTLNKIQTLIYISVFLVAHIH